MGKDPRILEKEIREWDPEGVWEVKIWNRTRFILVEVQAGSASLAETMAMGSLRRDGEGNCSVVEVKRIG